MIATLFFVMSRGLLGCCRGVDGQLEKVVGEKFPKAPARFGGL